MHGSKNGRLRLPDRPADYKRLGIAPVEIAEFEDGQRISTESGRYEWWYFDAHLDDGAAVVVVFYTKPIASPDGPLAPTVTINITLPDGRAFDKLLGASPEMFHASKSTCDVRIGTNRFTGDLDRYHITATIEEISVDIELREEVPAWRPKSGHFYFGAGALDGKTGKPVADLTRYIYHDADTRYVVSFEREKTILQAILTDRAPLLKRIIARLIGFGGAYHRFTGKVRIEKFEAGVRVERFEDRAIWELMYFGKTRALKS
jgi:hypothetical protein